ncbi:MAG: UDP-3-O-[3-hydroxymyristoyl] N-acetylglucosamine deacetylase [Myxococcales bacterium]|nr:UDP-3-O-[3-hydroxymyristoyl] N-acetylglucosamine deacetylase [Myxococcales bacterium]
MRRTLAAAVTCAGPGLHSGAPCVAHLSPAPPGHGLCLNGTPVALRHVIDAAYATTLATARGPVRTVEHLLAALYGLGIDDAAIEVEGGEVPALDGSAARFVQAIAPCDQPGRRTILTLREPVEVRDGARWCRATPAQTLSLAVEINFPALGVQRFAAPVDALPTIAAARTFGFARDADPLRAAGLARGAGLSNTLVFDDHGRPLNPEGQRLADEPARHKWLDLLGDLALLGAPLRAQVEATRGGHALHHRLVAALQRVAVPEHDP